MKLPHGLDLQGIAIPFFSAVEWERARAVIDNPGVLGASYAHFIAKIQRFEQQFTAHGTPHIRVAIRVHDLLAWEDRRGRKVNSEICAEFAAWLVKNPGDHRG